MGKFHVIRFRKEHDRVVTIVVSSAAFRSARLLTPGMEG